MQTETIDRLFLELSQVTQAKTKNELELAMLVRRLIQRLRKHDPDSHLAAQATVFLHSNETLCIECDSDSEE